MIDPRRYPPDWRRISEYVRFTRAGGRCECSGQCGTRGSARACDLLDDSDRCCAWHGAPTRRARQASVPLRTSGVALVVLTTAHLDGYPTSDGDPAHLLAMCQACHLAYDRHQQKRGTRSD